MRIAGSITHVLSTIPISIFNEKSPIPLVTSRVVKTISRQATYLPRKRSCLRQKGQIRQEANMAV
jgi:hypothetical protein